MRPGQRLPVNKMFQISVGNTEPDYKLKWISVWTESPGTGITDRKGPEEAGREEKQDVSLPTQKTGRFGPPKSLFRMLNAAAATVG